MSDDGDGRWMACRCGCAGPLAGGFACQVAPRRAREYVELEGAGSKPAPLSRRSLVAAAGAATFAATLADVFQPGAIGAYAQAATGPLEKTKLTIGYVPITCTVPLLLADAMGFYRDEGLEVSLVRTPGWALVRDKLESAEFDASHLVLGLPFTMSLGIGSVPFTTHVASVQNTNGDAIVMALRHKDKRDPGSWKGLRFGIPHEHSIHAMLLRYYLAEHGLDPDHDVELRVYPPPDSVANMASGNLDGMLFAEPWGQRAVFEGIGYIHTLSRDIFPDHPCCTLSVGDAFMKTCPNSFGALLRAVIRSATYANKHENRMRVAELLAPANYLNQPKTVLQQVLLGHYADGLGKVVDTPDRIDFDPYPYDATGVWLLTQLRRWKIVPNDIDYQALTERVFLSQRVAATMTALGLAPPTTGMAKRTIMGKVFDPTKTRDYIDSFAIRRA